MIQRPNVIGLKLCRLSVIEERTRNVSLIDCYRGFTAKRFPFVMPSSTVCAALSDGIGECECSVTVRRLETDELLLRRSWRASFTNPLKESWFLIQLAEVRIPEPGRYTVALGIDGEDIADLVLSFHQAE